MTKKKIIATHLIGKVIERQAEIFDRMAELKLWSYWELIAMKYTWIRMTMNELKEHIAQGCNFGQPDGADDTVKECDCLNK